MVIWFLFPWRRQSSHRLIIELMLSLSLSPLSVSLPTTVIFKHLFLRTLSFAYSLRLFLNWEDWDFVYLCMEKSTIWEIFSFVGGWALPQGPLQARCRALLHVVNRRWQSCLGEQPSGTQRFTPRVARAACCSVRGSHGCQGKQWQGPSQRWSGSYSLQNRGGPESSQTVEMDGSIQRNEDFEKFEISVGY